VLQVDDVLPRHQRADERLVLRAAAPRGPPHDAHRAEDVVIGQHDQRARREPLAALGVSAFISESPGTAAGGLVEPAVAQRLLDQRQRRQRLRQSVGGHLREDVTLGEDLAQSLGLLGDDDRPHLAAHVGRDILDEARQPTGVGGGLAEAVEGQRRARLAPGGLAEFQAWGAGEFGGDVGPAMIGTQEPFRQLAVRLEAEAQFLRLRLGLLRGQADRTRLVEDDPRAGREIIEQARRLGAEEGREEIGRWRRLASLDQREESIPFLHHLGPQGGGIEGAQPS
jgi:hypothetical protein